MKVKTTLKFILISFIIAFLFSPSLKAQKLYNSPISILYTDGSIKHFEDLDKAFAGLKANCVVYIPAGHYSASKDIEINVPCAIYGAGCRPYNGSQEFTQISANLKFDTGASNSTIQGVRVIHSIYLIHNTKNIFIRNVYINGEIIASKGNRGCVINSSVVKNMINGVGSDLYVSNCLAGAISNILNGSVRNSILIDRLYSCNYHSFYNMNKSDIYNNICVSSFLISGCFISNNLGKDIVIPKDGVTSVFVKYDANNKFDLSKCDYHIKAGTVASKAGTDGKDLGIYGGDTPFDDSGKAPIPLLLLKEIAPQTDKDGKLKLKIQIERYK